MCVKFYQDNLENSLRCNIQMDSVTVAQTDGQTDGQIDFPGDPVSEYIYFMWSEITLI